MELRGLPHVDDDAPRGRVGGEGADLLEGVGFGFGFGFGAGTAVAVAVEGGWVGAGVAGVEGGC